jgi:AraC-like DNA-binding protein
MSYWDHLDQGSFESSAEFHPFSHYLAPLSQCSIPAVAYAAPLPLAAMLASPNHPKSLFFAYACSTVEAHILSLTGPETKAMLLQPEWISLLYVTSGVVSLIQAGQTLRCGAGGWLLVPTHPTQWHSSDFGVVCVLISWAQLDRMLTLNKAGCGDSDGHAVLPTDHGCLELPLTRLGASMLTALQRGLLSMSDLLDGDRSLVGLLGLEDYLCRLVGLLVAPSLRKPSSASASLLKDQAIDPAWDALLAYIEAHLDQPLSLMQLQNQSNYSKRAIQYHFRRQLGCTATQWIRARRLDQAQALLSNPSCSDSVASIAQASGYRSMSLFSIEFQQRFHIKPSLLLRQSRQSRAADH